MTVAIVGPGQIGTSIALAARRTDATTRVVLIDRGESLESARGADVIVLAAPVDVIVDIIAHHAEVLRSSVVLDTGSTKRTIMAAAQRAHLTSFVGGHPMAGSARSGAASARADLFDGRPWFLVTAGAASAAVGRAKAFVESLGARPVVLDDEGDEHDRVMAAVSHLPQVVASLLAVVAAEEAGERLAWAGSGLRDTTRLAESPASMWESILASNADHICRLTREMARQLNRVSEQLERGESVRDLLDSANRARGLL